ncbi:MAG: hypothetical protein PUB09_06115 [Firmicutes bacterium]|nr:hypothetical protein [Bacillota bacterium]
MKLYLCVDDTDDLTKSTSTGKIADMIASGVCDLGGRLELGITRHQLLIHEDIDYTSHNSSMCMVLDMADDVKMEEVKAISEKILRDNMAGTSDPGICFCKLSELEVPEELIVFGKRAQKEVIQKKEAYDLADSLKGVELYEYGGTGAGVIGAIAGVGLRLSGCDGMFRGKVKGFENQSHTADEWKKLIEVEQFVDFASGSVLPDDTVIVSGEQIKRAMVDRKISIIAKAKGDEYVMCKKKEIFEGDKRITTWFTSCDKFCQDNDIEECWSEEENACYNCLYRRWTADGYVCTVK